MLNKKGFHSTAAIVCEVEDSRPWGEGCDHNGRLIESSSWVPGPDYVFQISDCDRSIKLELDFSTDSAMANDLYKIDKMIGVLSEFREAVADEQRLYKERVKRARITENA